MRHHGVVFVVSRLSCNEIKELNVCLGRTRDLDLYDTRLQRKLRPGQGWIDAGCLNGQALRRLDNLNLLERLGFFDGPLVLGCAPGLVGWRESSPEWALGQERRGCT